MKFKSIGVMCGSSDACDAKYLEFAYSLGQFIAKQNYRLVYGGGAKGLMRKAADGALESGGEVYGYMPKFMTEIEWQHKGLTKLVTTETMSERKDQMMKASDVTVFLPGGSGTMEEFFQLLVCKRLGQYTGPLILFNLDGYYEPLKELLNSMIQEKFHQEIHGKMYSFCETPEEMQQILDNYEGWSPDAIKFAAVK